MTDKKAKRDPWTDPDPQPGDFDESIEEMGPEHIQHFEGGSAKVIFLDTNDVEGWQRARRAEREKQTAARPRS